MARKTEGPYGLAGLPKDMVGIDSTLLLGIAVGVVAVELASAVFYLKGTRKHDKGKSSHR